MKEINLKIVGSTAEMPEEIRDMRLRATYIWEVIGLRPVNNECDVFTFTFELLPVTYLPKPLYKKESFKQNAIYRVDIKFEEFEDQEISGYYQCSLDSDKIQLKKVHAMDAYDYAIEQEHKKLIERRRCTKQLL